MTKTNEDKPTTSNFTRADGRATNELRPVRITRGFTSNPAAVSYTHLTLPTSDLV